MDYPESLDLNAVQFSENLICYKHDSNESFNIINQDEYDFVDIPGEEDNFAKGFNDVFKPYTPFSADNKKDMINEVHEITNVDDFIQKFQNYLNDDYYNKNFDCIIEKIEKRFPLFFNEKTNGLLYIIQKLKFFELIKQDKIYEAKEFYKEKLLILIKEQKKESWEKKCRFFKKLLNNPKLIFKQGDLQKKYYGNYTYEFEKAIRNFLHEEDNAIENNYSENKIDEDFQLANSNSNNSLGAFNYKSSFSMDIDSSLKFNSNSNEIFNFNNIKPNKETTEKNEIVINEEEKDELDMENISTKDEFSDFEDEIQQKCVDNNQENKENKETKETNNEKENAIEINGFNYFNNDNQINGTKSFLFDNDIDSCKSSKKEYIIDTSTKNIPDIFNEDNFKNDCNSINNNDIHFEEINTNIIKPQIQNNKNENKKNNKKKKNKNEETIYNQLPFLKSFRPTYVKRETIDKKIIRSFKNYITKGYKEKRFIINEKTMDQNFFINLIFGNLLPPLDFHDLNTNEYIKFNSFNCSYLLWFFSKKGVKEIYYQFYDEKGKDFINDMSAYYEITPEDKSQLNNYIMNFPNIFDISLVNNITQGETVKHLYRTVDKNKKIQERSRRKKEDKPDLDLKKMKSNESQRGLNRSRDYDDGD